MVPYTILKLDKNKCEYFDVEPTSYALDMKRWERTMKNLQIMFDTNKEQWLISPERRLSKEELEEYRKFFCPYAKEVGHNCVYFEVPIILHTY